MQKGKYRSAKLPNLSKKTKIWPSLRIRALKRNCTIWRVRKSAMSVIRQF